MKKDTDVLTFVFEEIDLSQIKKLIPDTRSKYAELREQIMAHIEQMAPGKTFIFAPDKKNKMEEKQIRGLQNGLNKSLADESLNFKVKYSTIQNAFVVIPVKRKYARAKPPTMTNINISAGDDIYTPNQKLKEIAELLNAKYGTTLQDLKGRRQKFSAERRALVTVARDGFGLMSKDCVEFLGKSSGSIAKIHIAAAHDDRAQAMIKFLTSELKGK